MTDRRAWGLGAGLILSAVLLAGGLFLPALTLSRFFFSEQHSLAGAVFAFAAAGNWFLFTVTFLLTILFPLGKVGACAALWLLAPRGGATARRLAAWLAALSRWSMADVFIIALVVLAVDGSLFTTADLHIGVLLFTAGVLLSTWAARRVQALAGASA